MNDYEAEQLDKKAAKFMAKFFSPKMQGQLRHFLTSMGGVAVAKGLIDAETMIAVVGAVMAAIGFVWSWSSPEKKP